MGKSLPSNAQTDAANPIGGRVSRPPAFDRGMEPLGYRDNTQRCGGGDVRRFREILGAALLTGPHQDDLKTVQTVATPLLVAYLCIKQGFRFLKSVLDYSKLATSITKTTQNYLGS